MRIMFNNCLSVSKFSDPKRTIFYNSSRENFNLMHKVEPVRFKKKFNCIVEEQEADFISLN